MTLKLDVDTANASQIGQTPKGRRVVVPIVGGTFSGERLNGTVDSVGYDWPCFRADGVMEIDVRLVLRSDDNAVIYFNYHGRLVASADVHGRMASGEKVDPSDYSLTTVAAFETGAEQYQWLNNVIAIGVGSQSGYQPEYTIYQVGR